MIIFSGFDGRRSAEEHQKCEKDDRRARCRALIAQLTCLRLSADTNACSDGLVFALQVKSRIDPSQGPFEAAFFCSGAIDWRPHCTDACDGVSAIRRHDFRAAGECLSVGQGPSSQG